MLRCGYIAEAKEFAESLSIEDTDFEIVVSALSHEYTLSNYLFICLTYVY